MDELRRAIYDIKGWLIGLTILAIFQGLLLGYFLYKLGFREF